VSVSRTLVESKMCTFILESTHLSSTSVPFTVQYTHDGASAKFSTNSNETGYSVGERVYALVVSVVIL
jgi:hypothetical protein